MIMKRRDRGTVVPFIVYLIITWGIAGAYIFATTYLR